MKNDKPDQDDKPLKQYEKPSLIEYGSVRHLTRGQGGGSADGMSGMGLL